MTRRRALLAWALLGRPRPRSGSGSLGKLHPHRAPQRVEGPGVRAQPAPKTARALHGGVARSGQRLRHPGLLPAAGPERAALPRADAGLLRQDRLQYEGRGWNTLGTHSGPTWNPIPLGISFMGNYMDRVPPPRAIRAAQSLLACGVAQGFLTPSYEVKGHRDV
eukprot:bmy_06580T0